MSSLVDVRTSVIVPNWNGRDSLGKCLDSLERQSVNPHVIVIENNSTDGSLELLRQDYPDIEVLPQPKNLGFAGGVNVGMRRAIERGDEFVALLNNDAVAEKQWLEELVSGLKSSPGLGIATSKILSADGERIDSTGEFYSAWGLPYPRGRGETDIDKYNGQTEIFAASGGASLYRVKMLQEISLFDKVFFAYYEDVDLSFRAQLAGWKVAYVPEAVVYHQIGATSSRIRGFVTYQTLKNLPILLVKNVPRQYLWRVGWRLLLADTLFFWRAVSRGHLWTALKGKAVSLYLLPSTLIKRRRVQRSKKVSDDYIWDMLVHDLPPNARALRRLRSLWWKLRGKQ